MSKARAPFFNTPIKSEALGNGGTIDLNAPVILLPKPDTNKLEIILDGNQRAGSVNQVKKVKFLKAIGIPYSDWNGIQKSSLESLGNHLN